MITIQSETGKVCPKEARAVVRVTELERHLGKDSREAIPVIKAAKEAVGGTLTQGQHGQICQ